MGWLAPDCSLGVSPSAAKLRPWASARGRCRLGQRVDGACRAAWQPQPETGTRCLGNGQKLGRTVVVESGTAPLRALGRRALDWLRA
jgi:hypothetical protein